MKIFISWSGERSRLVAVKLREWLPLVLQGSEPWLSSDDIRKGSRWQSEMREALQSPSAGILCLTYESVAAPWLVFEAGAISTAVAGASLVCTYLVDVDNTDVGLPLGMFQSTTATREDTFRLIENLNELVAPTVPKDRLAKLFASFWPELEESIAEARQMATSSRVRREQHDLLEEILNTIRGVARAVTERPVEAELQRLVQILSAPGAEDLVRRMSNAEQRAVLQEELRKRSAEQPTAPDMAKT